MCSHNQNRLGSSCKKDLHFSFKESKGFLKVAHVNVENIIVHKESFVSAFQDKIFDIIAVTETFLKPVILSSPYVIDKYNLVRHDREGKEGGGLALYINKIFNFRIIASSQANYCKKPEYIIVEVEHNWKILVCVVYKPPKLGFISEFFDIVSNLLPTYDNLLILGDFNVDLSTRRVFAEKTNFLNLVNSLNLVILPLKPTFHLPASDTWLDLMITNDVSRVKQHGQFQVSGVSYHDVIYVELNLKLKLCANKGKIIIRDFKNVNKIELKEDCMNINWKEIFDCNLIDEKVELFNDKLLKLYNKHVLERQISNKRNPCPWLDRELKTLMLQRDSVYRQYVRSKDVVLWERYRVLRNRIKRLVRDSRNRYLNNLLQSEKSNKDLWNVIKSQGAGKEAKSLVDPVVNLNNLNDFFCGVNNNINVNLFDYYTVNKENLSNIFSFKEVDSQMVHKAITDISSNSVGNYGIHIKFLKIVFEEIQTVLCHIFNFSLLNSVYPSQWKKCIVLPFPKVKNPTECKNYRPINILSVLGKVLDKLVYKQVCEFVNENSILNKYQSGYRSSFSTQTALVKITDDIRHSMDNRQLTVLVLLDFSRAFDCVNHQLLLQILRSYNFDELVIIWFKSYLECRLQRVKTVNGLFSDWKYNGTGVPQGSTLSALLFSLYINRITEHLVFCRYMLYADDMQLYINCRPNKVNDAIASLNVDLTTVFNWCLDHGLSLNITKCKPIIFGTTQLLNNINYDNVNKVKINDVTLSFETSVINLGIRMCSNLSWAEQVNYIHKRVFQSLYQFRRLCFNSPVYIKKLLVSSLIFPFFDYSNLAYCDLNETLTLKLQRAQNACIRYIYNLKLDDHVTEYYKELNWLKIKERREYSILSLMYKVLDKGKPEYLYEKYSFMYNVHFRQTRFGQQMLQFPRHRTVIYTKSFHTQSIRLMNNLEQMVKSAENEKQFLKYIKQKLLLRYA